MSLKIRFEKKYSTKNKDQRNGLHFNESLHFNNNFFFYGLFKIHKILFSLASSTANKVSFFVSDNTFSFFFLFRKIKLEQF